MPKILVSNNSELLRHFSAAPFRRLEIELVVATSGDEAVTVATRERPQLVLLDAEMPGRTGYDVVGELRKAAPGCRVVLVMGKRINAAQMRKVAESGCDEVLIAPMAADQLYDVVALQLGLPRRGAERYAINLAVVRAGGEHGIDGRVTNLSVDGARLILPETVPDGTALRLTIVPDREPSNPIKIDARVVWAQVRGDATVVGASFENLDDEVRRHLARLTQFEVVEDTERVRIVLKGDITEATNFEDLQPVMLGRVDFDLSQVRYMNSLGVRDWVEFLRKAPIQGYEFHACSVPFVLQASLVEGVLGRGVVSSFFAPYVCETCEHQEERLLQTATVLAAENRQPPTFACPSCSGRLVFDDIPERFFGFLPAAEE